MSFERRWMRLGGACLAAALPVLGSVAIGCVGDDNSQPNAPGADAAPSGNDATTSRPEGGQPDAAPNDTGSSQDVNAPDTADASPPMAHLRFASLLAASPSLAKVSIPAQAAATVGLNGSTAPSVDVCVAPHGTTAFTGPLLANDGLAGGIAPAQVSEYIAIAPGQYDVRIVPVDPEGGAPTCDAVPDASVDVTNLPPIPAGATLTVAAIDPTGTGLPDVLVLNDETTTAANKGKARFVNVATGQGSNADWGLGGGGAFTRIFSNVAPDTHLATGANVDSNGYADIPTFTGVDSTLQTTGSNQDYDLGASMDVAAGDLLSVFAMNIAGDGYQYGMLVCRDGKPSPLDAHLTDCSLRSSNGGVYAQVRFANLITDDTAGNLDVCVQYHGLTLGAFLPPAPLGFGQKVDVDAGADAAAVQVAGGVPSGNVTGYFYFLHGGFTYDVRLVKGGPGADCTTAQTPDGTITIAPDATSSTLAAFGYLNPPDAGAGKFMIADYGDFPASATNPAIRFIHIDSADTSPATMTDLQSTPYFSNVAYGAAGTASGDVHGYVTVSAPNGGFSFLLRGTQYGVSVNLTGSTTIWSIPGNNQILVCDDDYSVPGGQNGLWNCTIHGGG